MPLELQGYRLADTVLVGNVLLRLVAETDRVVLMFAVIVAISAFFLFIAIVEIHAWARRGAKRHVNQILRDRGQHPEHTPPVPVGSLATYWQPDGSELWRLMSYTHENLAMVSQQEGYVLWRIFTDTICPTQSTIFGAGTSAGQLLELEDLLALGIRTIAPSQYPITTIEGRTEDVDEAKRRVLVTIKYIRSKLLK